MTPERKRGFPTKEVFQTLAVGIGLAAYFIFPVDAIPDFLPAVGIVDDGTAVLLAGYLISEIWGRKGLATRFGKQLSLRSRRK